MKEPFSTRLTLLREKMKENKMDAYLIVSEDYHGSEYVGDYFKCREYISGFDGSAGRLVVTMDDAGLWTDGRYFLQAEQQLEGTGIHLYKVGEEGVPTILEYLKNKLAEKSCLAYDGKTVSAKYSKEIAKALSSKKIVVVENVDLVKDIWKDRPGLPSNPVWLLEEKYSGKSVKDKLSMIRDKMKKQSATKHLISALDDIAWTLNLRGDDIAYNPVALSYLMLGSETGKLYINESVLTEAARKMLTEVNIETAPYQQIYEDVRSLDSSEVMMIDEDSVNALLLSSIPKEIRIKNVPNPSMEIKAVKNIVEIENEILAHKKDGVALTKLIYWMKSNYEGQIEMTEIQVAEQLEKLRTRQENYLGQSFAPIIATGAHGAIVHYEADEDSNCILQSDTFVLMDTGGHYMEGTTDVTRTVSLGVLSEEQKHHYTQVLKGHINLAMVKFKYGCDGTNLDVLARSALWQEGLDYNHGTGHGVGYLLNVHEGPNSIRTKHTTKDVPFQEGMITSNEPGLYLEGEYGIRLENLVLCKKAEKTAMGQFMKFQTLTLVPFERDAILVEELSKPQLEWINAYHQMVYDELAPHMTQDERTWLYEITRPLDELK